MNLIITTRARLLAKYGETGLSSIAASVARLLAVWQREEAAQSAYFAYVDDAASLAPLGLKPISLSATPDQAEASAIRNLLDALEARGQEIAHLLILGGPDVVPFFSLPNPVVDVDDEVLSDNPYGARGSDVLVPDRYVGRMPDATPADATPMLQALATAVAAREVGLIAAPADINAVRLTAPRPGCLRPFAASNADKGLPTGSLASPPTGAEMSSSGTYPGPTILTTERNERGFGYAAEIWRNSSQLIYQTVTRVAGGEDLRTCPPTTVEGFMVEWLRNRFLYFNLHGVIDNSPWFGQSTPASPLHPSSYPIALRPDQLQAAEGFIRLLTPFVFSEACYGAYITAKSTEAAISLSFLAYGAAVFVGSTVTSYGRPDPPLSEADLLAALFFEHLYTGQTAGRALVEARRDYARQMLQQHGTLDEDDDKTLMEFVLYGDPTLRAF